VASALSTLVLLATTASAQATRDEWLRGREAVARKLVAARHAADAGLPRQEPRPAAVLTEALTGPVELSAVKLLEDFAGNLVVVGEIRNVTAAQLTFIEVTFAFFGPGGEFVGSDFSFAWGARTARLTLTGGYTTALGPGEVGFFKVWTDLPAPSIATYAFASEAETFDIVDPFTQVAVTGPMAVQEDVFGGAAISGSVTNHGTVTSFFTRVAFAGYLNGTINDVSFAFVDGSTVTLGCSGTTTDTGVAPGATEAFQDFLVERIDTVVRHVVEWDEIGLSPDARTLPAGGGSESFTVIRDCGWTATSQADWITIVSGQSSSGSPGMVSFVVAPNPSARRTGTILVSGMVFTVTQEAGVADADGDGLPTAWEVQFGLDPDSPAGDAGPAGDPDQDGVANLDEHRNGTHPRGFFTRYFAEGTTGSFFDLTFAVANVGSTPANVLLRFLEGDGTASSHYAPVGAMSRHTIEVDALPGLQNAEISTIVESDELIVADRTMTWDGTGYGSHAETSVPGPATTWYLAEGATHSGFNLFYLIQNPNPQPALVEVTYLRPAPDAPLVRPYVVPANARFTIWVDDEGPDLANTDVSAVFQSDRPIIVERAMYLDRPGRVFAAGHESAGIVAPATEWFLAEGATGAFFDLFVLIANPGAVEAAITATFLLPDGPPVVKHYAIAPRSRFNVWVDTEDARLADTAVSTVITSTNGVPVIAERAMWWPGPTAVTWAEAHNSAGLTSTGGRWGLADGEIGGARGVETYILIANRGGADTARVTLLYEDGTFTSKEFPLAPSSRTNVAVAAEFPGATGRRFGAIVEALGPERQIVVERAMYSNAGGTVWAAGTNAVATRLPDAVAP
jgi:hypothetical protein